MKLSRNGQIVLSALFVASLIFGGAGYAQSRATQAAYEEQTNGTLQRKIKRSSKHHSRKYIHPSKVRMCAGRKRPASKTGRRIKQVKSAWPVYYHILLAR